MSAEDSNGTPRRRDGVDRRGLFAWISVAGAGLLAAGAGALSAGFLSGLGRRSAGPSRRVSIGRAASFPRDGYAKVVLSLERRRLWKRSIARRVVWVRREAADEVRVLSGRCTHMGCSVRWEGEQESFACPCHRGRFAADGAVVSGPPPAPLQRLPARVEAGEVFVDPAGLA